MTAFGAVLYVAAVSWGDLLSDSNCLGGLPLASRLIAVAGLTLMTVGVLTGWGQR